METIIANLVHRFERGGLTRRQLIHGLSLLVAAGGTSVAGAQGGGMHATSIGHVSVQVSDLQRSIEFYSRNFGLSMTGEDKANRITRLGIKSTLVSLHQVPPTGLVDHFAINVEGFNKERVTQELKQRGIVPQETLESGFHIKDPDGVNVQIT